VIETRDIRVDYGDLTAVEDVSLTISDGEVFGLIGPNGAGKTSLIRVLATLQEPTYGDVRIDGMDLLTDLTRIRRVVGYMPDLAPVYKDLTCYEFVDLFARAYFVDRNERRRRIDEVIEQVDLAGKRKVKAGTLSRGMTQRLVLAKTLIPDPSVLLLDEPASGLDPLARIDLRDLLKDLGERGKTVLVSSHILNELSEFCTSIGIMERGRLVLSGSLEEIIKSMGETRRFRVETLGQADAGLAVLEERGGPQVSIVPLNGSLGGSGRANGSAQSAFEFEVTATDEEVASILAMLVREGVSVTSFYERRRGVEDVMKSVGASRVS
jgi:ABC-2 type transport system ATP-binding protein